MYILNNAEKRTYGAIVIGSGIAGGWAAKEFCDKGVKTLVLERGRKVTHNEDYPTTLMSPWEFPHRGLLTKEEVDENPIASKCYVYKEDSKHFIVKDKEHPYEQDKPFDWIRGYQVGGKSLLWARQTQRWSQYDFDGPARDGYATPWPINYKDIDPWYSYVEYFAGISGNKDGLDALPDGDFLPAFELTCVEKHFQSELKKHYTDRHVISARCAHISEPREIHLQQGRGRCLSRNLCQRGCPYGGYFSSNASTLPWAAKTGNLTLRPDSIVESVIYDEKKKKAVGVRVIDAHTNEMVEYYAKVIFVTAAALNTNAILLNSKSDRFPNGLGNDSGVLGKFVAFHNYRASISAEYDGYFDFKTEGSRPTSGYVPRFRNLYKQETNFLRGYAAGMSARRANTADRDSVGESLKNSLLNPKWTNWSAGSHMMGETIPKETNKITLDPIKKDAHGLPIMHMDVSYDDNDDKMVKDFIEQFTEMYTKAGFKNIRSRDSKQAPGLDIHEMGGCRMGSDPKTSMLNKWNQMHAVKNVFVSDGASMTSTSTQNPSLTYMALTARAVDFAVKEMKKGQSVMHTFLGKTAAHIFGEHPIEELKDIAIVMPSQRGVLYLKKELAILGDRPFLSPSFFTIEEFALQMTDSTLIDPIQLLLEAFACFKQVDDQVDFDRFISWGQLMLKDFETLDMYLVDPAQIFSFLSEVKSIERWGKEYGEDHPEKFITPHTKSYFKLFDHLLEVYIRLQASLNDQGFVYRGMAYRKLADYLSAGKALPKTFKKIYFVGFNALSKGEEEIIRLLIKNGMAQTLWDADAYYVDNAYHRAGNWLKKYSNSSSNEFLSRGPFQWKTSDLFDKPKRIEILGLANPSAQVFVAMDMIRKWQQEYGSEEQVALVLADESLLDQVMLYVGEFKDRLNITMGYSLKKTQVFSLINLWWDLQKQSVQGKFSVSTFKSVCSHGLIDLYIQYKSQLAKRDFKKDLNSLYTKTDLYIPSVTILSLASDLPILKDLFAPSLHSFVAILKRQENLLDLILKSIPDQAWDEEAEAVKQALAVIESLLKSFEADDFVSIASGKIVLTQLLSQQKLTFVGSENRSLHVMGLLETRTLDFDRVIILSMNEGSLPGTRKRESLIPLDIANMAHFSLPTFTQADAVASYHFYRLLQRPREVVLCYVQSSDKSGVKEMSRFIKQIKHDWKQKNPLIEIYEPWIEFSTHEADFDRNDGSVEKSPLILDKVKSKLANSGLSTSAITMFSTCSLKYFYAQILGMRKEKQLEDELGADVFGTWVHKVLELVDKKVLENYEGVYDRINLSEVVLDLDQYLVEAMTLIQEKEGVFELEKGFNFVLKEVAKTLLENYYSKSNFSKNTKLIALESKLTTNLKVRWGQEILDVKLTGRIDRLDVLNDREIRIIDYKTGKVDRSELKSGELGLRNSILLGELKPKILQLWVYKYLLASELSHVSPDHEKTFAGLSLQTHSVKPGIISFRNLKEGVMGDDEHDLWFESGPIWDNFLLDSQAVIEGWVQKILDVNMKFEKTKEVSDCQYCDFKVICQREL